ncbi:MAG: DNA-directed RNA polymerase subunit beta [Parcubacteria group bacterium]|nr:DNA-directed RNA polymerase subunit beta [Parcubacteria group bacterium]
MNKKYFGSFKPSFVSLPFLAEIQLNSWQWFLEKGLRELFDEISPIKDYTGKDLELEFIDYYLDEAKYDEVTSRENNLSYEAPLRVRLRLTNKRTGEIKEQEIFMTDFPVMTPRGTFIVNGVERVVVSQLIRSVGVFFTAEVSRGRKLFGAKLIPNRGAWLEFETDSQGVISVKIDRKRKIPATIFLKMFGMGSGEKILDAFKEVDVNPEINFIKSTLSHDSAKDESEAFVEIYHRLRPGEPVTPDTAKSFIESMFSFERYDISPVGRFKLDQRLSKFKKGVKDIKEIGRDKRVLNLEDIVAVIKEIIRLNNDPDAKPDDIDHLGNRRVRALGELLQTKLRLGISRLTRIIRDRMSTFDIYTLTPAQLINTRHFMASVKEFFTSSQLCQFMDQVNPLSELEHERRLSAMGPGGLTRERAGFEVRDVHPSHYGRICPIETPEGPNIGLVGHFASYARVNELGLIETPYIKVEKGLITKEIVYLNALEESEFNIAHAGIPYDQEGRILAPIVEARVKGKPTIVSKKEINYMDVAPQQSISIATSLIPFLEHDDANRALMGSNMQRQAVPCIRPQAPVVATGVEAKAARDSGRVIVSDIDGEVAAVDANQIIIKSKGKKPESKVYKMNNFLRSNAFTAITNRPIVKKKQEVKKGDVIADGIATDKGELALGQNILCAFVSFFGSNFEDAIVISERILKNDRYTSIHIEDFTVDVRDTKLGPEITTRDIPNVSEERLKNLDEEGIVMIGAEVRAGDILVGKISPKGEADLTSEERLLRAIFGEKARDVKDTSLALPFGKHGRVISVKIFSREKGDKLEVGVIKQIKVEVAQLRKLSVGDKMAGRHGNKGVISKILPEEDMPYLETGRPIDIILNPLSVASRMNLGQILETHLGWIAKKMNYQAITPALSGVSEEEIRAELKKAGMPEDGKVSLYDGRTGELFDNKVTVGHIYIMKLHHLVEDKIHMRSIGPYSLITQQPLGGKAQFGGQRFGEMEVWALEGYGASHTLQEMLTIKSDDVHGRSAAYDAIISGEKIRVQNLPASFNVFVNELKGLSLNVELIEKKVEMPKEEEEKKEQEKEMKAVKREALKNLS